MQGALALNTEDRNKNLYDLPELEAMKELPEYKALPDEHRATTLSNYFDNEILKPSGAAKTETPATIEQTRRNFVNSHMGRAFIPAVIGPDNTVAVEGVRSPAPGMDRQPALNIAQPDRPGVLGFAQDVLGPGFVGGLKKMGEMPTRAVRGLGEIKRYVSGDQGPGIVENATTPVLEGMQRLEEIAPGVFRPSKQANEGGVRGSVVQGLQSFLPSAGAGMVGAGIGTAIGGPIGAVAGYALGAGVQFGLAEFDSYLEEAKKQGKKFEDSVPYAAVSGAIEFGGEALSDIIGAKIFGLAGKEILPFKDTVKKMLTNGMGAFVKNYLKQAPVEVATEMGQEAGEAAVRKAQGLQAPDAWEAAKAVVGPTLFSTLLFSGGAHYLNTKQKNEMAETLRNTDGKADPQARLQAASVIGESLGKTDPQLRTTWENFAFNQINKNAPIPIDKDTQEYLATFKAGKQAESDRVAADYLKSRQEAEQAQQPTMALALRGPEGVAPYQEPAINLGQVQDIFPNNMLNPSPEGSPVTPTPQGPAYGQPQQAALTGEVVPPAPIPQFALPAGPEGGRSTAVPQGPAQGIPLPGQRELPALSEASQQEKKELDDMRSRVQKGDTVTVQTEDGKQLTGTVSTRVRYYDKDMVEIDKAWHPIQSVIAGQGTGKPGQASTPVSANAIDIGIKPTIFNGEAPELASREEINQELQGMIGRDFGTGIGGFKGPTPFKGINSKEAETVIGKIVAGETLKTDNHKRIAEMLTQEASLRAMSKRPENMPAKGPGSILEELARLEQSYNAETGWETPGDELRFNALVDEAQKRQSAQSQGIDLGQQSNTLEAPRAKYGKPGPNQQQLFGQQQEPAGQEAPKLSDQEILNRAFSLKQEIARKQNAKAEAPGLFAPGAVEKPAPAAGRQTETALPGQQTITGEVQGGQTRQAETGKPEQTNILHVFKNEEDGVEAHVSKVSKGYSVAVKDVDSGEFLPEVRIYKTEEQAVQKAKEVLPKGGQSAQSVRENEGRVLPGEPAKENTGRPQESQNKGGENLQRPAEAGTEAGNGTGRLEQPAGEYGAPIVSELAEKTQKNKQAFSEIMDRMAVIDKEVESMRRQGVDEKIIEKYRKRSVDPLLGEFGVTNKQDMQDTRSEIEAQNIPYVFVSTDGVNLGGVNKLMRGESQADELIKKVWGLYANLVNENGGRTFRVGGDEFMELWPGLTKDEVTKIRGKIEEQLRNKTEELGVGVGTVPHKTHGLPVGGLHTNYGIVDGVKGKYGDTERDAQELRVSAKQIEELEIAKKIGYTFNKETGNYERSKGQQETGTARERDTGGAHKGSNEVEEPGSQTAGSEGPKAVGRNNPEVKQPDTAYESTARNQQQRTPAETEDNISGPGGNLGNAEIPAAVSLSNISAYLSTGTRVTNPGDAAIIAALNIASKAQEHLIAIVTDKNNKVIGILQHSIGQSDRTQVEPKMLFGAALDMPGAKNIWLAHNHPSGGADFSNQDLELLRAMNNLIGGSGLKLRGFLAVTDKQYSVKGQDTFDFSGAIDLPDTGSAKARRMLPGFERVLTGKRTDIKISSPDEAIPILEKELPEGGILLLDGQNQPVGKFSPTDPTRLRGIQQAMLLRLIHQGNAVGIILYFPGNKDNGAVSNIGTFANAAGLHLMGVVYGGGVSSKRQGDYMGPDKDMTDFYATATEGKTKTPGLAEIQEMFNGQEVEDIGGGEYNVRLKNGKNILISIVPEISANKESFKLRYRRDLQSNEKIAGKAEVVDGNTATGFISLTKDVAGNLTLAHESFHILEFMGIITPNEIRVIRETIRQQEKSGKFEAVNREDVGGVEDRARFMAKLLTEKPKGILATVANKIRNFIDRIANAFGFKTVGGIARDIKTGDVYSRKGEDQRGDAFAVEGKTKSREWAQSRGLYLPSESAIAASNPSIVYDSEIVNTEEAYSTAKDEQSDYQKKNISWEAAGFDRSAQGFKDLAAKIYTKFVMREYPIVRLAGKAGRAAQAAIENQVRRMRGKGGIVEETLTGKGPSKLNEDGTVEYRGSKSLKDILKPLSSKIEYRDYESMRVALRDVALSIYRPDIVGTTPRESIAELQRIAAKYNQADLEDVEIGSTTVQVPKKLNDISKLHRQFDIQAVLDPLHEAGFISDSAYTSMMEAPEGEFYASFMREMEAAENYVVGSGGSPVKRIKGTERDLKKIPSVEATIANLQRTVRMVEQVKCNKMIVDLKDATPDLAEEIVEVKPNYIPVKQTLKAEQDPGLRKQLDAMCKAIGTTVEQLKSLGNSRLGQYSPGLDDIELMFATTERTYGHEMGHAIDEKIDLIGALMFRSGDKVRSKIKKQLRLIADSRAAEGTTEGYKKYCRKREEQVAELVARYVTRREWTREVAPDAVEALEATLRANGMEALINMGPSGQQSVSYLSDVVFAESPIAPKGTIMVPKNGKKTYWKVPEEVKEALDGPVSAGELNTVLKIMAIPTRMLRAGATLSFEFMARNPVRDQFSAFVYSRYGYFPFRDLPRGIFHLLGKTDMYHEYAASGAENSYFVSLDRETTQAVTSKDLLNYKKRKFLKYVVNPVEALRAMSEFGEKGTRLGAYVRARKMGASSVEAGAEARELTLDFGRIGQERAINQIIAFWNANVQGTDKMVRAFKMKPGTTALKAAIGIMLPSILLWGINNGDEDRRRRYKNLPDWQKNLFWCIMPSAKDGPIIRIPKPFELGIIFGSFPERVLDYIYNKDEESMKSVTGAMASGFMPGLIPTAALPFIEHISNYSFFMGRRLESAGLEKLPPGMRATNFTTGIAKEAGKLTDISPIKLENWVKNWTGSLGTFGLGLADKIVGPKKAPEVGKRWYEETPMVKGFIAKEPVGSASKPVEQFFNTYEKATQAQAGYKLLVATDRKEAIKYREEKFKEIRFAKAAEITARRLSMIRKKMDRVREDKQMPPDQKRAQVDRLSALMTKYADRFNERYEGFEVARAG